MAGRCRFAWRAERRVQRLAGGKASVLLVHDQDHGPGFDLEALGLGGMEVGRREGRAGGVLDALVVELAVGLAAIPK